MSSGWNSTPADVRKTRPIPISCGLAASLRAAMTQQKARPVADWEELWTISENARIPTVIGFGKHRGAKFSDLPADYRRWLLNQPDLDPFVRKALMR